jgi:hypothetical protein
MASSIVLQHRQYHDDDLIPSDLGTFGRVTVKPGVPDEVTIEIGDRTPFRQITVHADLSQYDAAKLCGDLLAALGLATEPGILRIMADIGLRPGAVENGLRNSAIDGAVWNAANE